MNDEQRDPELDWVRAHWKAPEPDETLAVRVLRNYRAYVKARGIKRWLWWVPIPVTAAAVLTFVMVTQQSHSESYQPVAQPRFIVVSQGERP